jgi:methylenetetrahydrofolate reductase (NADPH)
MVLFRHPFTIELMPRMVMQESNSALLRRMPPSTRVFIPHLPTSDFADVIDAASAVQRAGLQPVPHVAARRWGTAAEAEGALRSLARALGPANGLELMIVGGTERSQRGTEDGASASGEGRGAGAGPPFVDALDFISSGVLDGHGVRAVCIAAHPEGIPGVPSAVVRDALRDKAAALRAMGIVPRAVTQFCFDARAIRELVSSLPAIGIGHALIGLVGPVKSSALAKYASACGVHLPPAELEAERYSPDVLVRALELGRGFRADGEGQRQPDAEAAADVEVELHLFPFGGFRSALDWLHPDGS